jgi:hypothetical protein
MSRNALLLTILLLSVALPVFAQPQQEESLGNVARQLREQKESNPRKATKVFTNDNLPEPKPGEAISSLPLPPEPPSSPNKSAVKPASPPSTEETGDKPHESEEDKVKTRDYWQDKFKAARRDVAKAKELQQLSEDELNLLQIQQVRELDSMAKQDLTAKVQAKQSEVDVHMATTEAAQKALNDLDKEFKDSGAPEDWSQTD